MPKQTHIMVHVPPVKPDCCAKCPFLGIIPESRRKKDSKKTRICLARMIALSKRKISIKESERAKTKHILHRPCDKKWAAFLQLPRQELGVSIQAYNECRIPYEQSQQYEIDFDYEKD